MKITLDNSEKILAAYKPLILKTVKQFGAFEEEESIDEARMILIDAIGTYDESKGTFGTYAKNLLRYHFLDKAKLPKARSIYEEDEEKNSIIDLLEAEEDTEEIIMAEERKKEILVNLGKINKKNSQILKLKFYQDLTNKEIGQIMTISTKTVFNRISMGLKEMREIMTVEI